MISDKQERLNFILASYNAGLGHIYDAMALAKKYGKNNLVWKDNGLYEKTVPNWQPPPQTGIKKI